MTNVLTGFGVVLVVMALGWVLARTGTLGPQGQRALAAFVYAIATPALLFDKLVHTDPAEVFSAHLAVAAISALAVGACFGLFARWVFGFRRDEAVIAGLGSSYANAGNLGVPLAAYVLGDAAAVVPVMLFQIAFYAPVTLTAIDLMHEPGAKWWRNVVVAFKNPMLLAAIAGIVFAAGRLPVPTLIEEPVGMLAGASVPLALVVFGMSLYGHWPRPGAPVVCAAVAKTVVQPVVAGLIGALVFGMTGPALQTAVLLGALPTAQNVYTYALRFRVGEDFARDTGVVSTVLAVPVIMVAGALLA
ncbi:permease [Corynebacterium frankenforstense DSM 45800]|uniref:Permease n=1 Tax=Corynebacterium frankenforstense DSM 45800 TaxID=1437875 RepID=A0A1L7CU32_9CORY|nr:AEC family transporter [Corynebacterium frankenforstense]APT89331.1 permease [Corynebacterium frankenforstense DSM 45800]